MGIGCSERCIGDDGSGHHSSCPNRPDMLCDACGNWDQECECATEEDAPPLKVQGLGPIMYSIELRDLFAMAVVAGIYANPVRIYPDGIAKAAYQQADAMLKERKSADSLRKPL